MLRRPRESIPAAWDRESLRQMGRGPGGGATERDPIV